jgi:hypothetical protein
MKTARIFLAAAVVLTGISTYSQAQERAPWTVTVPFDFTVRHTHLLAGKYTVKESGSVVLFTSQSGKTANVLTTNADIAGPSDRSSLTFQVDGGAYDLVQIRNMGSDTVLHAVTTRRAPARLEASNGSQTIEVAAIGSR